MPIVHMRDHAAQALALLLEQYQDKPRIRGLLLSFVKRCQELEDAAWAVITRRMIDGASGAQLDVLGRIVGQRRAGMDDATYRTWITARIRVNLSNGHADDVIEVLRLVDAARFRHIEYYPASFDEEYRALPLVPPTDLAALVRAARPAGVASAVVVCSHAESEAFLFSYEENVPTTTQGFSGEDESSGGYLAGVYE